jgi:hypothetical protein
MSFPRVLGFVCQSGWMQRVLGRPKIIFRKYKVAPRLGGHAVRRSLLLRLRVTSRAISGTLDPSTEF